jgi:ATP-dependent helicase HrpA
VDVNRKPIAAGRSLEQLQAQLKDVKAAPGGGNDDWRRATAKWERTAISGWTFGEVPERIVVSGESVSRSAAVPSRSSPESIKSLVTQNSGDIPPAAAGTAALQPVYAWPGLALEEQHVCLRLFRSRDLAREASVVGVGRLIELAIQKDLGWLQKDLRALSQLKDLYAPLGSHDELLESAFAHLKRHALPAEPLPELTQAAFDAAVTQARERLRGLPSQLAARLTTILQLRQQVVARLGATAAPAAGRARTLTDLSQLGQAATPRARHPLAAELDALLPAQFLEQITFERLTELPRYMKALLTRIERAAVNPPKELERARQLAPYQEAVNRFRDTPPKSAEGRRQVAEFRWLVEEFKVSLFAQELGTAVPVSAKRLDQQLEQLKLIC